MVAEGHYYLDVRIIGRSDGHSSVAAAAYRSGEKIQDERLGKTNDYTRKHNVEHSEILAPKNAPGWVYDRAKLWNETEKIELRKDSQLAREVIVTFPRDLSPQQRKELVKKFSQEQFVNKGMIADINLHNPKAGDGRENPHAHIMLSMRDITPDGFGLKNREWNTAVFTKDDQIKDKSKLVDLRAVWAGYVNDALAGNGSEKRVSHLSHEAQGRQAPAPSMPAVPYNVHKKGGYSHVYMDMRHNQQAPHKQAFKSQIQNRQTAKTLSRNSQINDYEIYKKRRYPIIEPPKNEVASSPPAGYAQRYKQRRQLNQDNGLSI